MRQVPRLNPGRKRRACIDPASSDSDDLDDPVAFTDARTDQRGLPAGDDPDIASRRAEAPPALGSKIEPLDGRKQLFDITFRHTSPGDQGQIILGRQKIGLGFRQHLALVSVQDSGSCGPSPAHQPLAHVGDRCAANPITRVMIRTARNHDIAQPGFHFTIVRASGFLVERGQRCAQRHMRIIGRERRHDPDQCLALDCVAFDQPAGLARVVNGYRSISLGISSTMLQGRCRLSSWAAITLSQPSFTAPFDPGRQNTNTPEMIPAQARDWSVDRPTLS